MASTSTTPGADAVEIERASRGRLTVTNRAAERLALKAAVDTPHVLSQSSGFSRLTGQSLPSAQLSIVARHVTARMTIAVEWPTPAVEVARAVQRNVTHALRELGGFDVIAVDVAVSQWDAPSSRVDRPRAVGTAPGDGLDADSLTLPAPARAPTAPSAAARVGVVIALAVLAAGGVALRDTAVTLRWLKGRRWTDTAIANIDGTRFHWAVVPIAVIIAAIGAWMLVCAVRPRRKIAVPLATETSVWMSHQNVARLASTAAAVAPNVVSATSTAARRKVVITARLADPATAEETKREIRAASTAAAQILVAPPRIKVRAMRSAPR